MEPGCCSCACTSTSWARAGIALFQVVLDDDLEFLHVEEERGILVAHRFVAFHAVVELVALGLGEWSFVHRGFPDDRGAVHTPKSHKNREPGSGVGQVKFRYEQAKVNVHPPSDRSAYAHGVVLPGTANETCACFNPMTLIRSISGIRGTIGGVPGEGLTPLDTVRYVAAFGVLLKKRSGKSAPRVVVWDAMHGSAVPWCAI
jgi:hypothetical protein